MTHQEQDTPVVEFLRHIQEATEKHHLNRESVEAYVLREGRPFRSQPLTRDERAHIDQYRWRRHQPKACYHNAQLMAMTMPPADGMSVLYSEGFVTIGSSYGIPHAWVSLNGKVIDTTLRLPAEPRNSNSRIFGLIPEGWHYYGVEFQPIDCIHSVDVHRTMTPLIDDWECHWPLLHHQPGQA